MSRYTKLYVAQIPALHEAAKLADRRLVRHRLPAQVNPGKLAQDFHIVKRRFGSRNGEVDQCCMK